MLSIDSPTGTSTCTCIPRRTCILKIRIKRLGQKTTWRYGSRMHSNEDVMKTATTQILQKRNVNQRIPSIITVRMMPMRSWCKQIRVQNAFERFRTSAAVVSLDSKSNSVFDARAPGRDVESSSCIGMCDPVVRLFRLCAVYISNSTLLSCSSNCFS